MTFGELEALREIVNEAAASLQRNRHASKKEQEALKTIYSLWHAARKDHEAHEFHTLVATIQRLASWRWPGLAQKDHILANPHATIYLACPENLQVHHFHTLSQAAKERLLLDIHSHKIINTTLLRLHIYEFLTSCEDIVKRCNTHQSYIGGILQLPEPIAKS